MAGLLWMLADLSLEGVERVPRSGPLIVVSNHLHYCDPPLLGGVLPRYIRFMAKKEVFKPPWGLIFTNAYGAFPVRRNELDRRALRDAECVLRQGGVVGMFPEGHRSHGHGLQRAFGGAALIARRSKAPVLPVGISGTEAVFRTRPRWPICVRVGNAFEVRTGCPLDESTADLMRHIADLLPPQYQGVYGRLPTPDSRLLTQVP